MMATGAEEAKADVVPSEGNAAVAERLLARGEKDDLASALILGLLDRATARVARRLYEQELKEAGTLAGRA